MAILKILKEHLNSKSDYGETCLEVRFRTAKFVKPHMLPNGKSD